MKPALVILFITAIIALAAPTAAPVWTDPDLAAKENADFTIQGEYRRADTAYQVIALGKGQFHASVYQGGLPGAGWDKSAIKQVPGDAAEIKKLVEGSERIERTSPSRTRRIKGVLRNFQRLHC